MAKADVGEEGCGIAVGLWKRQRWSRRESCTREFLEVSMSYYWKSMLGCRGGKASS